MVILTAQAGRQLPVYRGEDGTVLEHNTVPENRYLPHKSSLKNIPNFKSFWKNSFRAIFSELADPLLLPIFHERRGVVLKNEGSVVYFDQSRIPSLPSTRLPFRTIPDYSTNGFTHLLFNQISKLTK